LHVDAGGSVRCYDLDKKTDTVLAALSELVKGSPGTCERLSASQDGKWVFWRIDSYKGVERLYAAPIYGGTLVSWPTSAEREAYWCADSRHIVVLPGQVETDEFRVPHIQITSPSDLAYIYDVQTPYQSKSVPAPPGLRPLEVLAVVSERDIIACNVLSGHHDWVMISGSGTRYPAQASVWSLESLRPLSTHVVPLPTMPDACWSDRLGSHLVWAGGVWNEDEVQYWVCGVDGSNLHTLGGTRGDESASEVRLSPDDKQMYMHFAGWLWVAPVK
jgi:hypothetical protein